MNKIRKTVMVLSVAVFGFTALAVVGASPSVQAQDAKGNICEGAEISLGKPDAQSCNKSNACLKRDDGGNCTQTAADRSLERVISQVINILSVIVGLVGVIFVIIGGAKYITSGGDSGQVSSAKTTVIYALVGLIIAALAQVIVRFVLGKV